MLPPANRLRRAQDFRRAVRSGRRATRGSVVVHCVTPCGAPDCPGHPVAGQAPAPVQVGLIVPRTVGGAVTRNRVKRRLRAALRAGIGRLDAGSLVVVRARPAASTVSYRALAADLDAALSVASSSRPGAAAELGCAAADAVPGVSR